MLCLLLQSCLDAGRAMLSLVDRTSQIGPRAGPTGATGPIEPWCVVPWKSVGALKVIFNRGSTRTEKIPFLLTFVSFVSLPSSHARLRRDARMLLMSRARRAGRDKATHKFENLLTIGAHDDDDGDGDRVAGRPTPVYFAS